MIIYQQTDTTNAKYSPPAVNGVYYSYDGANVASAAANSALFYGSYAAHEPEVGVNVVRLSKAFTGDTITIHGSKQAWGSQTDSDGNKTFEGWARGAIAGIQIVEHEIDPRPTFSVNFGPNYGAVNGDAYGLVYTSGWQDLTGNNGTDVEITDSTGTNTASITWTSPNLWPFTNATERVLMGYLDNNNTTAPEITVKNIPYSHYDVIVYQQSGSEGVKFDPPAINGVYYGVGGVNGTTSSCQAALRYGETMATTAQIGTNAISIAKGFSGDLTIKGCVTSWESNGSGGYQVAGRGSIAAIQIVKREVANDEAVFSVNFGTNGTGMAGLVGGIVEADGWNDFTAASGTAKITSNDGREADIEWSSPWHYTYDTGVVDNFLRQYLDDSTSARSTIKVTNIPFKYYRVIVYQARSCGDTPRNPPIINGYQYSADGSTWVKSNGDYTGDSSVRYSGSDGSVAKVGETAVATSGRRADVKGTHFFKGDLTIEGCYSTNGCRCPISAFQIIEIPESEIKMPGFTVSIR